MNHGNCVGCGEFKKLVKSHIIPESFYTRLLQDEDEPIFIVAAERSAHALEFMITYFVMTVRKSFN